ncbi:chorismate mutase [Gammaproteobacteria bacterium 45_16_T64]|nr:chorismate mutase [Gammaproteobacteria bacterium 45_16_T64]
MSEDGASENSISLDSLRQEIDRLDGDIQRLLNNRARCAQKVADVKNKHANGEPVVYYRPEREAQVLRRVMDRNEGPLGDETVAGLFREIMSACLALEEPMKVAFLGPAGTFTQAAAIKHFGHAVNTSAQNTIDEVFREVASGQAHYGVVPVENTTEGMVNTTLDSFIESDLVICGEVELRIHHHLLVGSATKAESISRIYSHQQSFAQCRKWLDANYPNAERIPVNSNADAARRLNDEWHAAAIAGSTAAEIYGLEMCASNIEDNPDNTTRFLIVSKDIIPPSGADKTSIIVSTKDRPGALLELLEPFHRSGISLTRIETRPAPGGTWAYLFFIDFEGHHHDPATKAVLDELQEKAVNIKMLGSYPCAVL